MRIIIFKGLDGKEYTLFIERNKLNNSIMYWFNHNSTMFYKGIKPILQWIKKYGQIKSDVGQI